MARVKKQTTKDIAEQVRASRGDELSRSDAGRLCFPTGSTLLNLAISDDAFGGWGAGKVINLVGDSNTGKTLLALTGDMEMTFDEQFDDHRLIYDDAENALEMPLEDMFGPDLVERLEDPYGNAYGSVNWRSSETIEDVRNNIWRLLDEGRPFWYVLDSYDAVTSREEIKRQEADTKAQKKIDELQDIINTSDDDAKVADATKKLSKIKPPNRDFPRAPAILTETLRKIKGRLKMTDSGMMIISQTRDDMNPVSFAATKRRAGGRALKFYSSHEVWLAVAQEGQIKKEVKGARYTIGWNIVAKSARSKLTGKSRTVPLVCFTEYGVDDIGANIDWLLKVGAWSGSRNKINTKGFCREVVSKVKLIEHIEAKRREDKLAEVMQKAWNEVEARLRIGRKRRFEP